ncbi:hypothetical protein OUZ56_015975 [Daphnia magna]|uniref:Uncharacterized protein n=1 Tax=Daphnia magna TaxID=35525 RepID=A0ABR0APB6_9CRUS|nr:hypothetical protein OUZ56_015975 [Daphnia magna]
MALTTSPFFGLQIFIFLRYSFDNFGSFAPSGPHATTFSSSSVDFTSLLSLLTSSASSPSCRLGRLRLHLRLVVLAVFAFISVSSSWPSSPSSPSRRLGRLRLHLRLVVLAVFAFISVSSSWPSSPSSPSRRLRRPFFFIAVLAIFLYAITSSPVSPSPFTDRPQWPSPQGALGNAPVGTSLCRCGGGFLRVCIPCNGFRHRVSPDLSSDKSHLVRDPYDAMLRYCSLSNLRVAWPGSQRCHSLLSPSDSNTSATYQVPPGSLQIKTVNH